MSASKIFTSIKPLEHRPDIISLNNDSYFFYFPENGKSAIFLVLLKILLQGKNNWKYESLHDDLHLSISAIHRSLDRCVTARFLSSKPFNDFYVKNLENFYFTVYLMLSLHPGKGFIIFSCFFKAVGEKPIL